MTIKQYVIEGLFPSGEDGDQAWEELRTLLGQRIADGLAGEVSAKSIDQIVDDEMAVDRRP